MMSNTIEDMIKKAMETLDASVRTPIILNVLQQRGIPIKTAEDAEKAIKIANRIGEMVIEGTVSPVPSSAFEDDGRLSKHASAAVEDDFLHFAPELGIDLATAEIDDRIKSAAAIVALAG